MRLFEAIRRVSQKHKLQVLVAWTLLLFVPFAHSCALHIHDHGSAQSAVSDDRAWTTEAEAPCRFVAEPSPHCAQHELFELGVVEAPATVPATEVSLELPAIAASAVQNRKWHHCRTLSATYTSPASDTCPTYLSTLRIRL